MHSPEEASQVQGAREAREVPGGLEQGRQSAEDHKDQVRGWACPCNGEGGGQGDRGYQHQNCSVIDPSSIGHESSQWDILASG